MEHSCIVIRQPDKLYYIPYSKMFKLDHQSYIKQAKEQGYSVYCTCNGTEESWVPMYIKENKNVFSVNTFPNKKDCHAHNCIRYGVVISKPTTPINHNGIEIKREPGGNAYINFNVPYSMFVDKGIGKRRLVRSKSSNTDSYHKSRLYSIIEYFLLSAWHKYVRQCNKLPWASNLFYTLYSSDTSSMYKLNSSKTLNDLLFIPCKSANADITDTFNKAAFAISARNKIEDFNCYSLVIGEYGGKEDTPGTDMIRIKIIDPKSQSYFYIPVNKTYFENKFDKCAIKKPPLYIGAFVGINDTTRSPVIKRMEIVPVVKNRGLLVSSSHERYFAVALATKGRLFYKPPQYLKTKDTWGPYVPDFVLCDVEPNVVVEVFGYPEANIEYHIQKERKLIFYEENNIPYICWNAYKREPLPSLKLSK